MFYGCLKEKGIFPVSGRHIAWIHMINICFNQYRLPWETRYVIWMCSSARCDLLGADEVAGREHIPRHKLKYWKEIVLLHFFSLSFVYRINLAYGLFICTLWYTLLYWMRVHLKQNQTVIITFAFWEETKMMNIFFGENGLEWDEKKKRLNFQSFCKFSMFNWSGWSFAYQSVLSNL